MTKANFPGFQHLRTSKCLVVVASRLVAEVIGAVSERLGRAIARLCKSWLSWRGRRLLGRATFARTSTVSESWQSLFPDQDIETMLQPAYPLKGSEDSVSLYDGPIVITGGTERHGTIDLTFGSSKPSLRWNVVPAPQDAPGIEQTGDFIVRRHGQDWSVPAHGGTFSGGWINHAEFGDPGVRLRRLIANWINLPNIVASGRIVQDEADGHSHCWIGRWQIDVDTWRLTLDRRYDYDSAIMGANAASIFAFTHVMELSHADGSSFDVDAARQVLECLRVCFSFAFGRWVAPALPVGYDADDRVTWESWASPICDPMKEIGSAWLHRLQSDSLAELVGRALPAFLDSERIGITRFQMILAVEAVETGFVEQRVLATFSALENLEWTTLVLGRLVSATEYRKGRVWPGERRLRRILELACIPTDIDAAALPSLANFASNEDLPDGPAAVVSVRNRLVHPRQISDQIYQFDGLVCDAWYLSRHYLNLLILHSIGYGGSYVKLLPPFGWAGDAKPVPWVIGE